MLPISIKHRSLFGLGFRHARCFSHSWKSEQPICVQPPFLRVAVYLPDDATPRCFLDPRYTGSLLAHFGALSGLQNWERLLQRDGRAFRNDPLCFLHLGSVFWTVELGARVASTALHIRGLLPVSMVGGRQSVVLGAPSRSCGLDNRYSLGWRYRSRCSDHRALFFRYPVSARTLVGRSRYRLDPLASVSRVRERPCG